MRERNRGARPAQARLPEETGARDRRASAARRWRKWARLRRAGRATARIEYDGKVLARLILAGWLPPSDTHSPDEIGAAVTDMLARVDLPKKC
jgi:hypothetical protein